MEESKREEVRTRLRARVKDKVEDDHGQSLAGLIQHHSEESAENSSGESNCFKSRFLKYLVINQYCY